MDLTSRLRSIVRGNRPETSAPADCGRPELTYEPDAGGYEAGVDVERIGEILGGRAVLTRFGQCLAIDRRYESDRRHGTVPIGDCELEDGRGLHRLDPSLGAPAANRTVFIDLGYAEPTPQAPDHVVHSIVEAADVIIESTAMLRVRA